MSDAGTTLILEHLARIEQLVEQLIAMMKRYTGEASSEQRGLGH